jgi:hypothetical protein
VTTATDIQPGVYDIPADDYHADPIPGGSLSSTGARKLLPPGCPALYHYEQGQQQTKQKRHLEFGTAVHTLAFGDGPGLVRIDADNYKTTEARQAAEKARIRGDIPLLPAEMQQAQDMAAALLAHPQAGDLLTGGEAEQTYLWRDDETGIWCRARLDYVRPGEVIDLKTTQDVSLEAVIKAIHKWGYHQQRGWYVDGYRAIWGYEPEFRFVFIAKTPPYLITVVEPDVTACLIGEARNRRARHIYAECQRTGHWPAYDQQIWTVPLPAYAEKNDLEEYVK